MPYYSPKCNTCALLHRIQKLEYYERMWIEEQMSIQEIHDKIKEQERPENVPSYDSLKRHFKNHVKAKFEAQADEYAKETMMKRMRESASVVDEILTNLRTTRDLSNATIDILEGMLKAAKESDDVMHLREMTQLINSVTRQIGEIRRTLEFVHKLRKELKMEPDTKKKDAIRLAEIMDKTIPEDVLFELRKELKESGLAEF